ncbi:hypothetical protein E2562_018298 [Oryza meyeriana var. granulata]|uniref:Uncharacterized protein n=1 Tax=Oryza meyeriana var. granulata TaxID=110450 RepID=A0A6G1CRD2_9ORYZ|nr:hypothetical protein E2562_018298 [Oryza meyeriana var. granulata]
MACLLSSFPACSPAARVLSRVCTCVAVLLQVATPAACCDVWTSSALARCFAFVLCGDLLLLGTVVRCAPHHVARRPSLWQPDI